MNRADRAPLLLIVAGVLMLLALAAYPIDDADGEARRRHQDARAVKVTTDEILLRLDRMERTLEAMTPR